MRKKQHIRESNIDILTKENKTKAQIVSTRNYKKNEKYFFELKDRDNKESV